MTEFEIKEMLAITEESDRTFFKIDSICKRYCINQKGLIFDHLKKRHLYPYFFNKKLRVRLHLDNNTKVTFKLAKLLLMAFSSMDVDLETYVSSLKYIHLDNNNCNLKLDNLIWLIPNGGIECKSIPGYYSVPGNPGIVISKDYHILNKESKKEYVIHYPTASDKYPSISNNHTFSFKLPFETSLVHRLVGLAFIPLVADCDRVLINHKDGNKINFNVDNLEWSSYTENRIHAIQNGLCVQSKKIISINVFTQERKIYHSAQEAARATGVHAWSVIKAIDAYKFNGKINCAPLLFLAFGDKEPTSFIKLQKKANATKNSYDFFKLINIATNEVEYLRGTSTLCKRLKNQQLIELTNNNDSFESNGYLITKTTKAELPSEAKDKYEHSGHFGKKQKAIRVTNLANGEVTEYPNFDSFATLVGAKRKTIQRRMLFNNGVWNNFNIQYLN